MRKSSRYSASAVLHCGAAAVISHPAILMQAELSFGIHEKALPIQEGLPQPFIADKFAKQ